MPIYLLFFMILAKKFVPLTYQSKVFSYLCSKLFKKMKKNLILFAATTLTMLAMTACQERQFTVEGTIEGAPDSMLYFDNAALTGVQRLDSVKLTADGQFVFHAEAPSAPEFYVLRIGQQIINLSIDSTETVQVKAHYPEMASKYEVSGSDNCQKIQELTLKQQALMRRALALDQDYSLTPAEAQDSLQRMMETYKNDVAMNYIFVEPQKAYAYFALFQTLGRWLIFNPQASGIDMKAFAAVATSWDTFYPEAPRSKNLHNISIENQKNQKIIAARNSQQIDQDLIEESGVLELKLTDKDGQQQTLTGLKGKVVLLDFHSFALKDSPQRILMLRDLYNKYHEQGLEIYQVSVDSDEHFWKQQTRELPWISVRDDSGVSISRYNVPTVPEFFLIDRNNQLQKRSSQMKDVEKEIQQLLSFR